MRLFRFCSPKEIEALLRGATLKNIKDHYKNGRGGSLSTGFCFTPDPPKTAFKYLRGIVCPLCCVEYEVPDDVLTPSMGVYARHLDDGTSTTTLKTEYCFTELSLSSFRLIRIYLPSDYTSKEEFEASLFIYKVRGGRL